MWCAEVWSLLSAVAAGLSGKDAWSRGREDHVGQNVVGEASPPDTRRRDYPAMRSLLKLSEIFRRLLEVIALASGWLLLIMALVTTFDVVGRKFGVRLPSTKLQELEWHFHAAIFSLWMGYCYTINAHPRVDSFTEQMSYRGRAWIELFGCLLLALPYVALVAYYSLDFVAQHSWPHPSLDHQRHLRCRPLDGGDGHRQRVAACHRLSVRWHIERRSQSADWPCGVGRIVRTGRIDGARHAG
jgi:TRAP-type mannitol/chloroaromatic compound transport system permease small subunit